MNYLLLAPTLMFAVLLAPATFGSGAASRPSSEEVILEVKKRHASSIMAIPSVVGVGIGAREAEPCIKVFVQEKTPELEQRLPRNLEGFKVDVEAIGSIRPGSAIEMQ